LKIGNLDATNRTAFATAKLESKRPLEHEVLKITQTEFEYGHKRKLLVWAVA